MSSFRQTGTSVSIKHYLSSNFRNEQKSQSKNIIPERPNLTNPLSVVGDEHIHLNDLHAWTLKYVQTIEKLKNFI